MDSGGGRLGGGGLAERVSHSFQPTTSSFRPPPPHTSLRTQLHQGESLGDRGPTSHLQGGHRTGSPVAGLLQPPIHRPEGFRGLAPHYRPVHLERLHSLLQVPYGDSPDSSASCSLGRLDDFGRPAGRVLPSPHPSGLTEVPQVCLPGSLLSIQGPVFRADHRPTGVYQADGSGFVHPPSVWHPDATLSGRLACPSGFQDGVSRGEGQAPASVRGAGASNQPQEVVTYSIATGDIPRYGDRLGKLQGQTIRVQDLQSAQADPIVSSVSRSTSDPLASPSGPPFVADLAGQGGHAQDALPSASTSRSLGFSGRKSTHPLGSSFQKGSLMVVRHGHSQRGSRPLSADPRLSVLLGRLRRWMGSVGGRRPSVRTVVTTPKGDVHQSPRDAGSSLRSETLQTPPAGEDRRSLLRQYHRSRLSEESGGHEIYDSLPTGKGDLVVGADPGHHSSTPVHPGVSECPGRSAEPTQSSDRVRVDSPPSGGPRTTSPMAGDNRSFCHGDDGEIAGLLRPVVGAPGCGNRCPSATMGQPASLCIPPDCHRQEGSPQAEVLSQLPAHSDSTVLASEGMVSGPSGPAPGHSSGTAPASRPAEATSLSQVPRKSPHASADCMATVQRFARQAGFSRKVAKQLTLCRKKSTRLNYQVKWVKFRRWCRRHHHTSSEPTIPKVAEFLTYLFRVEKLSASTIKGYRAMLSSVFKFSLPEISTSPILKDLLRSFEVSAPRPLRRTPTWDLDKVLEYLSGPNFEPLSNASFRDLSRKALFLLAMATAKRISEVQALTFSVSYQGEDIILYYDPYFLAKTETAANPLPRSVKVLSLTDFAGNLEERVLCPVRAIRYLRRAVRARGLTPSRLFVSPSDPTRAMSRNAMSFFLRQLITESGAVSSSVSPRAHDIRGIATSLNYWVNNSMSDIKAAATWKSNRIFAMRYLRDMTVTRERLRAAGPLVVAGSRVDSC